MADTRAGKQTADSILPKYINQNLVPGKERPCLNLEPASGDRMPSTTGCPTSGLRGSGAQGRTRDPVASKFHCRYPNTPVNMFMAQLPFSNMKAFTQLTAPHRVRLYKHMSISLEKDGFEFPTASSHHDDVSCDVVCKRSTRLQGANGNIARSPPC